MKIFLDSNIIISASIIVNSISMNNQIKHECYQESKHLITELNKPSNREIGIISSTVVCEVRAKLHFVVKKLLQKSNNVQKNTRISNEDYSLYYDYCDAKVNEIFERLIVEDIDDADRERHFFEINQAITQLQQMYDRNYSTPHKRNTLAKERVKQHGSIKSSGIYHEVFQVEFEQVVDESRQIHDFITNESTNKNSMDKKILADTLVIKEKYNESTFYIASNDKRFFAPLDLSSTRTSQLLTDTIQTKFNIICDTPQKIRGKLLK